MPFPMEKQKDLTTGEAAKIAFVSFQTIISCCDSGALKHFRIPGSRDRRIPRMALYKFLKESGVPTDALEDTTKKRVLFLGGQDTADVLKHDETGLEVTRAESMFDAGIKFIEMSECIPPIAALIVDREMINREITDRKANVSGILRDIAESAHKKDPMLEISTVEGLKLVSLGGDQPEGFDLHFPEGMLGPDQIMEIQGLMGIEVEEVMQEAEED